MSSISANQHLKVFVSTASAGVAFDGTSAGTGVAPEGLQPGEITFVDGSQGADGNIGLAVPPANADYWVFYKDLNGVIHKSPKIKQADIIRTDGSTPVAPVAAVQKAMVLDFTALAAPVTGDSYVLKVRVPGYGGLVGAEDECFFYGNHVVKAGDSAVEVATGLVATLNKQLAKAPVPFITALDAGGVITITGVAQAYVQGRWEGRHVDFDISLVHPHELATGGTVSVVGTPGNGNGNQVAAREEFYAGYGSSYKDRYANWPRVTEPTLAADVSKTYSRLAVTFAPKFGEANRGRQRQIVECYFAQ